MLLQQDLRDKEVYLCGLLSDICVQQGMDGFLRRGAKVTVLEDLCQGGGQADSGNNQRAEIRAAVGGGAAAPYYRRPILSLDFARKEIKLQLSQQQQRKIK